MNEGAVKMELVKGYQLRTPKMVMDGHEQLFAKFSDGTVRSCVKKYSTSFGDNCRAWGIVDEVPAEAEYIGNYPAN